MQQQAQILEKKSQIPSNLVHGICHYHRQWTTADARGFRSRDHRIHSSGDYRNPPPPEEHAGLRRWVRETMNGPAVRLNREQCAVVGFAFVQKLQKMNCTVIILACAPTHVHVMFEPTERDVVKQLGKAKQFASLKCPDRKGQLWAESSGADAIKDIEHARRVFRYIQNHVREGAWIWRFDKDTP